MAATHAIRVCDVTGFVKMAALEAVFSQLSDVDFFYIYLFGQTRPEIE